MPAKYEMPYHPRTLDLSGLKLRSPFPQHLCEVVQIRLGMCVATTK